MNDQILSCEIQILVFQDLDLTVSAGIVESLELGLEAWLGYIRVNGRKQGIPGQDWL